jgi:23S rRNA (cytidine1920-2'-O)/16S rRNA (cytidine1409-2'-O)-methyltransferase
MAKQTERLDILVHQRGLAPSREKARAMIMAGEVSVNGTPSDKPGTQYPLDSQITLKAKPRFVSRGGGKLQGALDHFAIQPAGRICADVGASTGGFTDCLLQAQATKVYAIDVGYGILDATLRADPRVVVMERTNARNLVALPEPVSLVVVDASFISLKLLLPVFKPWLTPTADLVLLIKPQFEAGKKDVDKGKGVIRDPRIHQRVLTEVLSFALELGYDIAGLRRSPLLGPAGNVEFLGWFRTPPHPDSAPHLPNLIEAALRTPESPTE